MKSRYREPPGLRADSRLIARYVQIATDAKTPEDERTAATAALIELYRRQLAEMRTGKRSAVDYRLVLYVRDALRRAAREDDPLSAADRLVHAGQARQGRPRTRHRDFVIAVEVAEKIADDMGVEDAARAVAAEVGRPSEERVRKIYFAQRKADARALDIELKRRKADAAAAEVAASESAQGNK
jgi:hypothetical protein